MGGTEGAKWAPMAKLEITTRPLTTVPETRNDPRVRAQVVMTVLEGGMSVTEAASRLWVLPEVIEDWCALTVEARRVDQDALESLRRENASLRERIQTLVAHAVQLQTRVGRDDDESPMSGVRILGPDDEITRVPTTDYPPRRSSVITPIVTTLPDDFVMEIDAG